MMNTNCFVRPKKPLICKLPNFNIKVPLVTIEAPKLLTVDSSTECHTTPDNVALRMAQYLDVRQYDNVLEPHVGTGQLINALIESGVSIHYICAIEKHYKLCEFTQEKFPKLKVNQGDFLTDFNEFINEYDKIICNPPFKKIIAHMDQVYKCLKSGGVAVCLVPTSYKKIDHEVLENLNSDTFLNCKVNTKIIRIRKYE